MHPSECPSYEGCGSPLCPLDPNPGHIWYPGEEVCRNRNPADWVRKQRKIARLTQIGNDRFFSIPMIQSIHRVGRGLKGANPEKSGAEGKWLARRHQELPEEDFYADISYVVKTETVILDVNSQLELSPVLR